MKWYFNSPERVNTLREASKFWIGTPFFPHGRKPGVTGGCSCETLVLGVYVDSLFLSYYFKIPTGSISWAHANKESIISNFLDNEARDYFLPIHNIELSNLMDGDLLGFEVGGCVHHLGILVEKPKFIHCLQRYGVQYNDITDATYLARLKKVWRPIEEEYVQHEK